MKLYSSHGDGTFRREDFKQIGSNVIIERGAMVFHPENISLGNNIYVGHYAILKAYYRNEMVIEDNCWIGQFCFFHSAGGIHIEQNVGIGPGVMILTSRHSEQGRGIPILFSEIEEAPVRICRNSDIGVGSIILPGVVIGEGTQVGAGAVVSRSTEPYSVVAGVPARLIRMR
ncbi:MAG: acyltransferase [Acidobacteriota bacterium]|nr:acyltransferase [Blastocatellia bacterium]MDW8411603.1 acyltransferase [Acidobacteriota bacterium]